MAILHELSHAYHDQVLGFDHPRIKEAYEAYKKSGRGEKVLLHDGTRTRHYALTNQMEFFAEMTESYFGSNDFFPFNRVYAEYFPGNKPARSTVQAKLMLDAKVEIEMVAYKG